MNKILLFIAFIVVLNGFQSNAQVIPIETKSTSLIFRVENKKVYQAYFGKRLNALQGVESLGIVFNEVFPSFGSGTSDEMALIATHADGTMATDLVYNSFKQSLEGNIQTTTISLKDEKKPFYVELHFLAYQDEDVLEQWVTIRNQENGGVTLSQFASSAIGFKAETYYLTHFFGSWGREMRMDETQLTNGIKSVESKRGVRTTEFENPSFILSLNQKAQENSGEVVMGSLAWQGNFRLAFQIDDVERCQMIAGINPFASDYLLKSNEEFNTPRMILTYSATGKNLATINLHRWARKYNLRDGDKIRPIVLNSWEGAYFNFDAAKIKEMMDGAAQMGVEMFVLDDGWFGNKYPRDNDKAGLGDWQVNIKKLPKGIDDLIDHAVSKGLKFGIWVEPEMVNPKSELAEKHPEWIIQRKNDRAPLLQRNQLLLDLSNPKVQDFVYGVVSDLLTKYPRIAYIKWDANRHLQNFGSTYLPDDQQSKLWVEYAKGLDAVFHRLMLKYPETMIQDCSSGGGRVEYGTLKYTHEFWASDDTDPYERLFIQWGTNHIFPAIATAAHVTKSPNHQTGRETSLKFRFDVAMGGRLGLELSPSELSPEDLAFAKKAIQTYKQIRPIIEFGDLYRLQSPYDNDGFASINYVTPNQSEAILMVYSHDFHRRSENDLVRMKGLDPASNYRITEINTVNNRSVINCNDQIISGSLLMQMGIRVNIKRPLQSAVFHLSQIKQ